MVGNGIGNGTGNGSTDWTFGRKIGLGFACAGVVLLVIAIAGYRATHHLVETSRWVAHTHEVRRALASMLASVVDAESSTRGFVITGSDGFLEVHKRAVAEAKQSYADARRLTADNAEQQRSLDEASTIIDTKLADLQALIGARRASGGELGPAMQGVVASKELLDRFRLLTAEMERRESDLLAKRSAEAEESAELASLIILWGSLGGLLLVAIVGWLITSSLTRQIGDAVQHIRSSSSELHAASTQQATGAKEQATAMSEIATTISELLVTTRQIAESSQRVAEIAEQTAGAARVGGGTVESTHEAVSSIKRQVDQVVGHMLDLGKKSQQIGAVLDIVSEMAEQTNILAINATIEAAGAGDAGKRFAVVADEIRKLADRVGGSTKEIRGLIDDVRSAVNTTVMATETSSKAVDAGTRQFNDVAAAFRQIAGLVSTTTQAAREIELSTKQQTTAVEQVNVAIMNGAQATRETEASSGQTLQTASQLASLSKELIKLVQPHAHSSAQRPSHERA